ncbi:ABC transporter permease [Micromonospora sp. NPDC000207]|uniref:ABC transporter permease n=1 Tax=Micromonospora sp. NPDC000207 TaxID=3154246 RepID=UPI003330D756
MTVAASIYPRSAADLLPDAQALSKRLGEIPSRNRLMKELRIGVPKANELRGLLVAEHVQALAEPTDEPTSDPWVHAEPIGPDPVPAEPTPAETHPDVDLPDHAPDAPARESEPQVAGDGHPGTPTEPGRVRPVSVWPVVLLALPAFVAVWSGWVGLGKLTGFGMVDLLPGIVEPGSWATIDSAITLPIGVETYGAYALYVWLSGRVPVRARTFAKWSALGSLGIGSLGQVAYHLLVAAGETRAPWWITMLVACLPVAVLGMGAALAHLVREADHRA